MADSLQGFLTKNEAVEKFNRSHRQLTRDLSVAVRMKKEEVLENLRLRTDDGKVRPGTEVTSEMIQNLSNRGLAPTWYIAESWAAEAFTKGKSHPSSEPSRPEPEQSNQDAPAKPAGHDNEYLAALREQITDLKKDKEVLKQQLRTKDEQITAANERTQESNVLMRELQKLLASANMAVTAPEQNAIDAPVERPVHQPPAAAPAASQPAPTPQRRRSSPLSKQPKSRSSAKRKSGTKQKQNQPAKQKQKQASKTSVFATSTPTFYKWAKQLSRNRNS